MGMAKTALLCAEGAGWIAVVGGTLLVSPVTVSGGGGPTGLPAVEGLDALPIEALAIVTVVFLLCAVVTARVFP